MGIPLKIASVLFILALPLLLVTTNIRLAANEVRLHQYGFERYGASRETGIPMENLLGVARTLIRYWNSDEEFVDIEQYSERDMLHLRDVKGLIRSVYRVNLGALAYIAAYLALGAVWLRRRLWQHVLPLLWWGSAATIALLVMLGVTALVGFDRLFLFFHLASFSNDLWQLPPGDKLIGMYSPSFFRDATLFIAGATVVEALVLGGIAWVLGKRVCAE